MSDIENSKLRFLLSPDEELADGSSKIWETFINAFIVLKFFRSDIFFNTYSFNYEH